MEGEEVGGKTNTSQNVLKNFSLFFLVLSLCPKIFSVCFFQFRFRFDFDFCRKLLAKNCWLLSNLVGGFHIIFVVVVVGILKQN